VDSLQVSSTAGKMEAAVQDRAGWSEVVCGRCSTESDKNKSKSSYRSVENSKNDRSTALSRE